MTSEQERIAALEQELAATRHMVHTVMQNSADLGLIVEFFRESFSYRNHHELASALIERLQERGLRSCVMLHTDTGDVVQSQNTEHKVEDVNFIAEHANEGRIIEECGKTLINYQHISLLIENMPEDEARRGEYRDVLATLAEGLEAKSVALQMESQAEKDRRVKEEFFAIMSHELKTPLNSVIGFSELLNRRLTDKVEGAEQRALAAIGDNGRHLLGMIDDILELARFDSEEVIVTCQPCLLAEFIQGLAADMNNLAAEKGNQLEILVEDELVVNTDVKKLEKILKNLISNAIKFTASGKITITAELFSSDARGQQLVVSVMDTGIGIAEEDHERIFEKFTQLDSGVSRESSGAGVGLSFVKKLVEILQGEIAVESQLGQGSCFKVLLPLQGSKH